MLCEQAEVDNCTLVACSVVLEKFSLFSTSKAPPGMPNKKQRLRYTDLCEDRNPTCTTDTHRQIADSIDDVCLFVFFRNDCIALFSQLLRPRQNDDRKCRRTMRLACVAGAIALLLPLRSCCRCCRFAHFCCVYCVGDDSDVCFIGGSVGSFHILYPT